MTRKLVGTLLSTIIATSIDCHANTFAAATNESSDRTVDQPCEIRPLSGALDDVLMFNSNSPELVQEEGILASTFSPTGMKNPSAHLDLQLDGRFNLFAHHINSVSSGSEPRTLFIGALLNNPGPKKIKVRVLKAATYVSQPDAPFIKLPDLIENTEGNLYSGPGDRVTDDLLRKRRQVGWPRTLVIGPGKTRLLFNLPIEVRSLAPSLNGRSTLVQLKSNGPVYVATLARFAHAQNGGLDVAPSLDEWQALLQNGNLAGPRDKVPTPPGASGNFIYGRVAGVQRGSCWQAQLTDNATRPARLRIPAPGKRYAYPISSLDQGTFGTLQVESAPLLVRYPDTAYQAHGNYGVEYDLNLPLYNDFRDVQTVSLALETPIKTNEKKDQLSFFDPPPPHVFFRGTVELRYKDDRGAAQHHFFHLVQRRGQTGQPLAMLRLRPKTRRLVKVRLLYPPDATPPQVLTIATQETNQ